MKKFAAAIISLVFIGVIISGCTKTDTTPPVITITNNDVAHNRVAQFITSAYTDPGATATDDVDGAVTPTVAGSVNMNSAGDYTITYTATDKAGNVTTAVRTVTVDGALFLAGTYGAVDFVSGTQTGSYTETITASTVTNNKIHFTKFGDYSNAAVDATISGTSITIITTTVLCGTPPNDMNHTFSPLAAGTYNSTSPTTFTINFHDSSAQGEFDCDDVYTRN